MSKRLTAATIRLADSDTHQNRQLQACWYLGQYPIWATSPAQREEWDQGTGTLPGWGRLQRWAHMLGFGGHFATKSRRYSTTLTALREVRRAFQLGRQLDEQQPPADEPPLRSRRSTGTRPRSSSRTPSTAWAG